MASGTITSASYVNQPPDVVGDNTFNLTNRTSHIFTFANLTTETTPPYNDPEGDLGDAIQVVTLPAQGSLLNNGSPLVIGNIVTKIDIDNSLFSYSAPDVDPSVQDTWDFKVRDVGSGNFSTDTGQITMDVDGLPTVVCGALTESGGVGVTEFIVPLETGGGVLTLDFNANSVPDKMEIIHNGVKKATSGMTTPNEGPFDDVYGDPIVPTGPQASATDQFIGTSKGSIPDRQATFESETGLLYTPTKQQLIWWVYDTADVTTNANAVIRVTGPTGTAWDFIRYCPDEIELGYHISDPVAACGAAQNTFYMDTDDISTATKLWSSLAPVTLAPAGEYADGTTHRYWNGTAWSGGTPTGACPV